MPLWVRTILITAAPEEAAAAVRAHRAHVEGLRRDGRLRMAGEFKAGDGFFEVFEAADRKQAESIAAASPLLEQGLAAWMLRELASAEP